MRHSPGAYYQEMADRGRLILFTEPSGDLIALCTLFNMATLEELPIYHERAVWSCPPDVTESPYVYIDKLIAWRWNHDLWRGVERTLDVINPPWRQAIWYRPGQDADRRYNYRRRMHGHLVHD